MAQLRSTILANAGSGIVLAIVAIALFLAFDIGKLEPLVLGFGSEIYAGAVSTLLLGLVISALPISISATHLCEIWIPRKIVQQQNKKPAPHDARMKNDPHYFELRTRLYAREDL